MRGDNDRRDFFVDICGNDEMGEAVQLLGGTLEWKLGWIKEEGADWQRLVQVIAAAPEAERAPIRESVTWEDYFVGECDNEGMAKVVAGLGGTLEWRLGWMRDEGTSWDYVARELRMQPPEAERAVIRASADWRAFFVDICGNTEMSEAVDLLGGTLDFKLQWMAAEGADWPQLKEKIALCTVEAEKAAVRASAGHEAVLRRDVRQRRDGRRGDDARRRPRVQARLDARGGRRLGAREGPDRRGAAARARRRPHGGVAALLRRRVRQRRDGRGRRAARRRPDDQALLARGGGHRLEPRQGVADRLHGRGREGGRARRYRAARLLRRRLGNEEMAEAVDLLGGDLSFKLEWMVAEGADPQQVREKIASADEAQRAAVLADATLMKSLGDNLTRFELALVRAVLGRCRAAELTVDAVTDMAWDELKIALRGADAAKKTEIRTGGVPWRDAFVSACGNDEMAEAVDLIEGDLAFKLGWMKEEGTSWDVVKPKLIAAPDAERAPIRAAAWRPFFVDICGNAEMAEAVTLLGGDLKFKLDWMLEEGTSHELVLPVVTAATAADKAAVAADAALCQRLADGVGVQVFEALGAPSFVASALIDANEPDKYVEALRVIATAPSVPATVADLRTTGQFDTLLGNCPVGAALPAPAKTHVDAIFDTGGVTDPERKKLIHVRYRVELSDSGIDGKTRRRGRPRSSTPSTSCSARSRTAASSATTRSTGCTSSCPGSARTTARYDAIHLPGGVGYNMVANWPNASTVENHFRGTIRHEMGPRDRRADRRLRLVHDRSQHRLGRLGLRRRLAGGDGAARRLGAGEHRRRSASRSAAVVRGHFDDASVNAPIARPADPAHPFNTFHATCPIVQTAMLNQAQGAHNNFAAMPPIGNRVFTRRSEYQASTPTPPRPATRQCG